MAEAPLDVFKAWFKKQPHFPQKLDDVVLVRFLHSCYYDVQKAQKTAETFFSMRATCPLLFSNRDPIQDRIQNAFKFCKMAQYPISGNRFLWIWQVDDPGLHNYNAIDEAQISTLVTDTWLFSYKVLEESDIIIVCAKCYTFRMLMKINISLSRMQVKYYEEAMPFRTKEVHFINCPPIITRLYSFYKSFMKSETEERIHFHLPNSETLYQHIDKDDLPKDFGGNRESLEHFTKLGIQRIINQRHKLLDDSYWILDSHK